VTAASTSTKLRRPALRDGWVLLSLAVLAALLLAFVPFARGDGGTRVCVAAVNAWQTGPRAPSAADRAAYAAPIVPGEPMSPEVRRVATYEEWRDGPGACRDDSRRRLAHAARALGIGLAIATLVRRLASPGAGGRRV
jgi:hypothetical protein